MAKREQELLAEPPADLLKVSLYDYQQRGAIFLACRGRSILGDDLHDLIYVEQQKDK